ncbi:MAG: lipid-A-disaccharide synthase [Calditrichaeota bacterium]|nr:lipid-A-disaccharide synthase [Calditrichota bacterium]
MSSGCQHVAVIAGEVSGDLHAAPVIHELKKLNPDLQFFGSGGPEMMDQGVELFAEIEDLAVMGFSGLPRILPRLSRLKKDIIKRVKERNVKLVILVDYPGFNLNLAAALKKLPNPPKIIHYIAPQVWAWRAGRLKKIKRVIDHQAVIFPFEEKLFRDAGVNATFVGNPLLDEIELYRNREKINSEKRLLAILPGSRYSVASSHICTMIEAANKLCAEHPDLEVGIGKAPGLSDEIFRAIIRKNPQYSICEGSRDLLAKSDVAMVCSGTSTLEAALIGTPQVVIYKTSFLNYHIIKRLIKLTEIALVNIVAGKKIVPELLQFDFTAEKIYTEVDRILKNSEVREKMLTEYAQIRLSLEKAGAARNVAEMAVTYL